MSVGGNTRNRRIALLAPAVGAILLAGACTAPASPTPTTTPTQWLAAGCLDGAGADGSIAPDLLYSGIYNRRGNATFSVVLVGGNFTISGDGSCSGLPVGALTIVRAADAGAAGTACDGLGAGATATTFAGSAWTMPTDAWACEETITL